MRVQINDDINMKKIGKFIGQRSRAKSLYICAREGFSGGSLLFAFHDRQMEVRVDVLEAGSVEIEKNVFGNIFEVFTHNEQIELWTEARHLKFKQRNFTTSMHVLNDQEYDLFSVSQESMKKKLLREEKKSLLSRLRVIDKELGV